MFIGRKPDPAADAPAASASESLAVPGEFADPSLPSEKDLLTICHVCRPSVGLKIKVATKSPILAAG